MHFIHSFPRLLRLRFATYRLAALVLFQTLLLTAAAGAQSFVISVSPDSRQPKKLTAEFTVTAKAVDGFKGTIFLKAYAPTLKTATVTLDRDVLNYPYSGGATVTVSLSGVYNGDLPIVIEGRNASLFSADTVTFIAREHPEWRLFDTLNSELPKSPIVGFEVDADNAIWLATSDKGVSRFDGTTWTHYPSSGWEGISDTFTTIGGSSAEASFLGNYAQGVAVDSSGGVWLLSSAGIARLYKGEWIRYSVQSIMEQSGQIPASFSLYPALPLMAIDRNDNIWIVSNFAADVPALITTTPALIKFDGKNFTSVRLDLPSSSEVNTTLATVAVSPDGTPWTSGLRQGEVWKYENSYWTYSREKEIMDGTSMPLQLQFDYAGNLWISGPYGLVKRRGEERTLYMSEADYIFPGNGVTTIGFDRRGYIWTGNGTLEKFQGVGGLGVSRGANSITRKFYNMKNSGLPEEQIYSIKVGSDLFAWILTVNRGIALLDGSGIRAEIEAISSVERSAAASVGTVATVAPNPIVDAGTIELSLSRQAHVRLTLMDSRGEEVMTLTDETIEAGTRLVPLDADGLAAGAYFIRLQCGDRTETHPVSIVR